MRNRPALQISIYQYFVSRWPGVLTYTGGQKRTHHRGSRRAVVPIACEKYRLEIGLFLFYAGEEGLKAVRSVIGRLP